MDIMTAFCGDSDSGVQPSWTRRRTRQKCLDNVKEAVRKQTRLWLKLLELLKTDIYGGNLHDTWAASACTGTLSSLQRHRAKEVKYC